MIGLGLIACLIFGYGLVSRRLEGTPVTAATVFVAAGLAAGWTGLLDYGAAAHAGAGQLLNLAVFLIFGVFAADALADATAAMLLYAVLSLTLIRMLPVAIATIGLRLRPVTIAFLGWFGPRGLASVILALVVIDEAPALAGLDQIFLTMTVTVLLSVAVHGVSAAPLTRRYAQTATEPAGERPAVPA